MMKKPLNDIHEDNRRAMRRFETITLRPHPMQFVINELIVIVLCLLALAY